MDYEYINSMDGYQFEKYCCDLLHAAGFSDIQQTKLSGDFGIDIIAEKDGEKFGIQCKRYSSPVGVQAVQEAVGGMVYYNCTRSMVISNQDFTSQAMEMARKTNTFLFKIEDLIKIAQDSKDSTLQDSVQPSSDDVVTLAKEVFKAFWQNGVHPKIVNITCDNNETTYFVQKESRVKLSSIISLKNEVAFSIGRSFEINIDYDKQCLLLIFNNRDVAGYDDKINQIILEQQEEERRKAEEAKLNLKGAIENGTFDPYLEDAARFVIEKDRASTSMIQRMFKIGFNRAYRIMDQLVALGVVGEEVGTRPGKVLISKDEFEEIIKNKREE